MSFPQRDLILIDCVAGLARDYELVLTSSAGSLTVPEIEAVTLSVKVRPTDVSAVITKALSAGISIVGPSGSGVLCLVSLQPGDTAALNAGQTYFFDVQVDSTLRGPEQAAAGRLAVYQPVGTPA
jgi:hypothetical protein